MPRIAGLLALSLYSIAACAVPTSTALVDLPELRVVTLPPSRGSLVILEVINSTPGAVSFEALACRVKLQELRIGEWVLVEDEPGECSGLVVELAPGARHPLSVETPADRGGRFRALAEGSSADGTFVIRSEPFEVE